MLLSHRAATGGQKGDGVPPSGRDEDGRRVRRGPVAAANSEGTPENCPPGTHGCPVPAANEIRSGIP